MTCLQPQYRGGGPWRILAVHHPVNLAHEWAPGWVSERPVSQKGRKQLREAPNINLWPTHVHTCEHVLTYTIHSGEGHSHVYNLPFFLFFSFLPFPSLLSLSFFLLPSSFFLPFLHFFFFLAECFGFFYLDQTDLKLLILLLHPHRYQCVSPGTSHKPVSCLLACNSSSFPLENQKTMYI